MDVDVAIVASPLLSNASSSQLHVPRLPYGSNSLSGPHPVYHINLEDKCNIRFCARRVTFDQCILTRGFS